MLGTIVGLAIAFARTPLLRALLFGVTTTDPLTFVLVSAGLVSIAAVACYVPARRAVNVQPVEALRFD